MKAHLLAITLFLAIPLFYIFGYFFPKTVITLLLVCIGVAFYRMALFIAEMYLEDKNNDRTR